MPASPPQFSGRSTFEVVEYAHERHLATPMIIFHDPRCVEYSSPGHPERPERITGSGAILKDRHPEWEWRESFAADEIALLRAHSPEHLGRIGNALNDFDADTPAHRDIYQHAVRSAGAAINAARTAMRR